MTSEVKEKYYPDGQLESKISYLNNIPHGLCEWWYPNGQLSSRTNYINSQRHGLYERWHPNGQLKYQHIYNKGKILLDLIANPIDDIAPFVLQLIHGFQL